MRKEGGGGGDISRQKKEEEEGKREKTNQFHSSSIKILGSGHVLPRKNPWVLAENVTS